MMDLKHAYLTVVLSRYVNTDYAKYHGHQSGHARSQVDLPKGADQSRAQGWGTKPNRKKCASLQTHLVQP